MNSTAPAAVIVTVNGVTISFEEEMASLRTTYGHLQQIAMISYTVGPQRLGYAFAALEEVGSILVETLVRLAHYPPPQFAVLFQEYQRVAAAYTVTSVGFRQTIALAQLKFRATGQ